MGAHRSALTLLGVVAVLLVVLLAASSGGLGSVRLAPATRHQDGSSVSQGSGEAPGQARGGDAQQREQGTAHQLGALSRLTTWGRLALVLALAFLVLAVVASLRVRLVRQRKLPPPRSSTAATAAEEQDSEPELLQSLLDEQLSALGTGTPRNAIVAAWVQLEDFASGHGIPREPADTPAEFVVRALGAYRLDDAPLERLADLYREARFSAHPMSESDRAEARTCLLRLTGAGASS